MDCKKGNKKGFTLIELLVVIAIIALLLAIILPAMRKVKEQAKAVVCSSNLKQWGVVIQMYLEQNDNKYWLDYGPSPTTAANGAWMGILADFYGDVGEFRTCPSASKPTENAGTAAAFGNTNQHWGPGLVTPYGFRREDYGSYGINQWINDLPGTFSGGWRGQPNWHWKKADGRNMSNVPVMADCAWYGGNPFDYASGRPNGDVPDFPDWNLRNPGPTSGSNWQYDMARFCMDRHNMQIDVAFADGSARRVKLPDLWTFKWHRKFIPEHDLESKLTGTKRWVLE